MQKGAQRMSYLAWVILGLIAGLAAVVETVNERDTSAPEVSGTGSGQRGSARSVRTGRKVPSCHLARVYTRSARRLR